MTPRRISRPPIQSLPPRSLLVKEIRDALLGKENLDLLNVDYASIELRMWQHLNEDKSPE